ncbi:MAG: branched-chain amino acid ABC transporter permease [Ilumatobacteraceae bacterium]
MASTSRCPGTWGRRCCSSCSPASPSAGWGSAYGALVGGFVVGVLVEISTLLGVPTELKTAPALLILILILLVRPQGILGRAQRDRLRGAMDIGAVLETAILQFIGFNACYYAIAAIGLNVQFGYAGLLNFGQAGFMAAGAYGLGQTVQIFEISLWWGLLIGIGCATFLGLLMGVPTLRLRSDYLAIVTIASAEIVRLVVRSVKFRGQFGGTDGLTGFARAYQQVGVDLGLDLAGQYGFWIFTFSGRNLWNLIVGWTLVAIFGTIVWLLMRSPWGRVLKAIREDEDAVRSLGKNVYSYKMQALILGGVIGSFAGMMLALGNARCSPTTSPATSRSSCSPASCSVAWRR